MIIAWACVLCTRAGSSAEEVPVAATPTTARISSSPASATLSASERARRLASLTAEGQRCKEGGDHDCVIDRYASAYLLLDHEDRTERLGIRYVDLMIDSCDALATQADIAQYRSRFEVFGSIIDLQISEIDNRHVIEPTRMHGKEARRHRRQEEQILEQRSRLEESKLRLDELRPRLDTEGSRETTPQPTIVVQPGPRGPKEPGRTTPLSPKPDRGTQRPREPGVPLDPATRRVIFGTIGIAGGSIATLSGISLMINGFAWTKCKRRSEDDSLTTECLALAGARDGISIFPTRKPEGRVVGSDAASKQSVYNWVSGSLVTAVGIAAVSWSAVVVKRARDEGREHGGERGHERARARRESIALAPSWSRLSPRQGGLSIVGRF